MHAVTSAQVTMSKVHVQRLLSDGQIVDRLTTLCAMLSVEHS